MKEDKKIQLNYSKSDVFTFENNKIKKKRNLGVIVASGRVGHNHDRFFKKNK